ncbi:3-deoxy-7-phosphoheptulonate synthase [Candidatus Woesearchaeota archaeon]|nr:3-deoxy-7-phosphoheptulonate synthase [Candidatus Woesearchaeota archaeon]
MPSQKPLIIIAGPCSIESEKQFLTIAKAVKKVGATHIRGGAFKPRTDPTAFQGHGHDVLHLLDKAKQLTKLPVVTELLDTEDIIEVAHHTDIIQIGTRNMHNTALLKKIAQRAPTKPILLKRGFAATKKELMGAIGYLHHHGHKGQIYVCERGIRTFADGEYSRYTLDVNFIAACKKDPNFKYPIIVDPSHPAGKAELVEALAYAGIAAGADGLIIEVSMSPFIEVAQSDKDQQITPQMLKRIMNNAEKIRRVVNYKS